MRCFIRHVAGAGVAEVSVERRKGDAQFPGGLALVVFADVQHVFDVRLLK